MTRALLILLLMLGAGMRALYLHQYRENNPYYAVQIADCQFYDRWAEAIAGGEGSPPQAFYQPPLYPYLLGALYRVLDAAGLHEHHYLAVYVLQLLLGVASLYLVFSIGRRMFDPAVGLVAVLLALLHANLMFWEVKLLISALEIFLSLLGLRLLLETTRSRYLLRAGVVVGLLVIARADKVPFAGLAALWIVATVAGTLWQRLRAAALFSMPVVLLVGMCFARNLLVAHDPVPVSANGGINFYFGNHLGASGINMAPSDDFGSLEGQRDAAKRLAERAEARSLTDAEVSNYWFGVGWNYIQTRTHDWLDLMRRKAMLSVGDLEADIGWMAEAEAFYSPVLRWLPLPYGVLLGLGVAGFLLCATGRRGPWLLLSFILTSYLVLLLFFMGSRFRLSAVPCLCVLGAAGLVAGVRCLRGGRWLRVVAVFLVASGIALYARHARDTVTLPGTTRPMKDLLYGNNTQLIGQAHAELGQALRARDAFQRVLAHDPDAFKAWFSLGRIAQHRLGFLTGPDNRERRAALRAEALEAFRAAVRLLPSLAEGHFRLGEVLREAEPPDLPGALAAFAEAVRREPGNVDYQLARIELQFRAGDKLAARQALAELERASSGHPRVAEMKKRLFGSGGGP